MVMAGIDLRVLPGGNDDLDSVPDTTKVVACISEILRTPTVPNTTQRGFSNSHVKIEWDSIAA